MVETFLNNLKFEKRYSAHTLTAYKSDLAQFTKFLNITFGEESIEKASYSHIRTYMAQLMDEGMQVKTVQRKLITLRSYFKFLMQENVVPRNPLLRVQSPKGSSRLPVYIEKADMVKLDKEEENVPGFASIRNKLIVQMFYQTGMRLSELKNLRSGNIDLEKSELKVLGKRNKERIIPFTNNLNGMICDYLHAKQELPEASKEFLFVLDNGKPVYEKFIYRTVISSLRMITTAEKVSPHILRHTYATHLLNNGANINAIKELLGHSSLAATQIYTHNNIEQLKQAHKNSHPRA